MPSGLSPKRNSLFHLLLSIKNKRQRALLLGYTDDHSFSDDDLYQARKIANQLAIALANSILVDDLATLAKGTIAALARTVDAKSKWTHGHSERVAEISVKIAKAMHLSEEMVDSIGRAGLLHDIIPVIHQHHEKFDGSGYPDGLKNEGIDIRARIMAIADV